MDAIRVVVTIIERDGCVFCAHRAPSVPSGPGWEFPGGRLEEGEGPLDALRREVREELGVRLSGMWLLDTIEHDGPDGRLSMGCYVCGIAPGEEPAPREYDQFRWIGRDELLELDWLPADREVARLLGLSWDMAFSSSHL